MLQKISILNKYNLFYTTFYFIQHFANHFSNSYIRLYKEQSEYLYKTLKHNTGLFKMDK